MAAIEICWVLKVSMCRQWTRVKCTATDTCPETETWREKVTLLITGISKQFTGQCNRYVSDQQGRFQTEKRKTNLMEPLPQFPFLTPAASLTEPALTPDQLHLSLDPAQVWNRNNLKILCNKQMDLPWTMITDISRSPQAARLPRLSGSQGPSSWEDSLTITAARQETSENIRFPWNSVL